MRDEIKLKLAYVKDLKIEANGTNTLDIVFIVDKDEIMFQLGLNGLLDSTEQTQDSALK